MTWVRKVLAVKIALSLLFWILPLLLLPAGFFPELGIPTWTPAAKVFLRLLGAAYLAIAIVEAWGFVDPNRRAPAVLAGLASSAGASIVLWHDIFYGELWNWAVLGKVLVSVWLVLHVVFTVALLATGLPTLLGRPEPAAPPHDANAPLPPY
jgi:hypothetical protein